MQDKFRLAELHVYPVKSMMGAATECLQLDDFGPQWDRRFMLVDRQGKFVTQRKYPMMRQLNANYDGKQLQITGPGQLALVYSDFNGTKDVTVWHDAMSAEINEHPDNDRQLSHFLQEEVQLVHMPAKTFRQVDRDYFSGPKRVSFADGFPFLLTNTASLTDLNARLTEPVGMQRFRPNIVVSGNRAFQEDEWRRIRIGPVEFLLVKPCSRCVMTTIDETGQKGREPLRTLSTYRKNDFGICFGQNMVALNEGVIGIDDTLEVLERH